MTTRLLAALVAPTALLATAALANESTYNCQVTQATSTVVQSTDVAAPFAGTFIGNYDATTLPTGTRTLPGFFGGSGNNPITYTASFALAGDISSHPTGTMTFGIDAEALQVHVGGLNLDMLGAVPGTLAATVNINYQSFHTVQPTSIYPGGVTIPVPVGNGTVSTFRAEQTGKPVFGVLVPQKNGTYTFAVAVPVNYIVVATLLGTPVSDGTPVAAVLPLNGTVTINTNNTVSLVITSQGTNTVTQPVTAPPFTDLALPIPTVIPAGNTANLLMSGTVTSVTITSGLNATVRIAGVRQVPTGDLNHDYSVNSQDIAICLAGWGTTGPGDVDGNGVVDSRDLTAILSNWQ